MSDFNFGQNSDFGLQVQEGHSALFAPDELPDNSSFQDPINEDEDEQPVQEPLKKPTKKPIQSSQPKQEERQPEHSALFDEEDLNEDLDEPKKGKPNTQTKGIPDPIAEDPETPDENVYKDYVQDMFKAGILTPMDGDDDIEYADENAVIERFNVEKQNAARAIVNSFVSQYGPEHAKAFNAIFVNGASPDVYYQKMAHIENLEKANLEDVSTQEKLVKSLLSKQGWSQEDIEEKLESVKSYDGLEKEAKIAHKYLLKQEQEELAKNTQQNRERLQFEAQQAQMYQQSVVSTLSEAIKKKEFGGIPVTQSTAGKVYDMMVKKQWNVNGKEMTTIERIAEDLKDPRNVEMALKVALLYNNNFDFSAIEKKAVTKETNALFTSMKRKQSNARKSSPTTEVQDNWDLY